MRWVGGAESTQAGFDERAARLAGAQQGVIARVQAARLGATKDVIRHRLRTGRWIPISRVVFRLAGSPSSWRQSLMAAVLAWGDGAVVSHLAAAALWCLAEFDPGPVELTVPRSRRRAGPGNIHRHPLSKADVTSIEGIPVTTPARTLIDLTSVAPREAVEEALDDALRRGMVSLPHLRRRLAAVGRPGRKGVAMMRQLLDERDPSAAVPDSVFERRLLRLLQRGSLPSPALQYGIHDERGLVGTLDFAYPDVRLAIEADGHRWHSGRIRWDHDRERRNRLTLLGWRVIHVTWTDLTRRPAVTVRLIATALAEGRPR
ncbi:MAG: type IV toxin-antitoxin system AbiEi family antitoxin [Actinomycetota bacterium]